MDGDVGAALRRGDRSNAPIDEWGAAPRATDGGTPDSTTVDSTAPAVVELRHEAGLTAGHTLGLRPGRFRLGPRRSTEGGLVAGAPEVVSFDLNVDADGETTLTAGQEAVAVEGVIVDRPVHLDHGDVIQLSTDHFVLRSLDATTRRRPGASVVTPRTVPAPRLPSMAKWLWFFAGVALVGLVLGFIRSSLFGVMLIGLGGLVATLLIRSRRRDRAQREHATQLANARSLFFSQLVDARKAAAETLRSGAATPAEIAARAGNGSTPSGAGLVATVASGDRSWDPPVVCHRDPGWDHQQVVDELSFLPAIPFTIDLDLGPVAIVGPRLASLAVARHIITTVLVGSNRHSGISVTTTVPADWRWLAPAGAPALHVLDGTTGPLEPRTIVVAPDAAAIDDPSAFSHVIELHEDGRASITRPTGDVGDGFAPHGITEQQAKDVLRAAHGTEAVIDLRSDEAVLDLTNAEHAVLDSDRLLVTGSDRTRSKNVLATAALRQAARHPNRSIFILDRGDRALIRLAQLEACHRYVAIDQIENVEYMVGELEAIEQMPSETRVLFLAPDLFEAIAFYRNSGRADLADRIDGIVARMQMLPTAASAPDLERVPLSSFLVWVDTNGNDRAAVKITNAGGIEAEDSLLIDLDTLPGVDLTASVARLTSSTDEESTP